MKQRVWQLTVAGVALLTILSGCASTGGGGGSDMAAPAAAAAPDYTNEMGDNGLPTPRAVIARYVDALGGRAAIESHKSSTAKGKFILAAMGMEGDLTIHAAAPNKMVMNIETPMGAMNQGFNGEVGWSDNPMTGAQVLEGGPLAAMKQQADFFLPLNYDTHFPTQETLEEVEFADETCYKVRLVDAEGSESFQYFSKESSLLRGQDATQDGPMGEASVTVVFSDYKDFGGVLTVTKQTMSVQGMDIENVIESITFDDVDPSAFEVPSSVASQL
jgi:hypothetical protein